MAIKTRRKWTSKEKIKVVLEGMTSEGSIQEICDKYKIVQTQYYKWKEILVSEGWRAFESGSSKGEPGEVGSSSGNEAVLQAEIMVLKNLVVELTLQNRKLEPTPR